MKKVEVLWVEVEFVPVKLAFVDDIDLRPFEWLLLFYFNLKKNWKKKLPIFTPSIKARRTPPTRALWAEALNPAKDYNWLIDWLINSDNQWNNRH